jgi:hypothetical protein
VALRAAKEAEDRTFGANILAGMARQLFYLGCTSDGLELVRLAQAGSYGEATPRIQAMLCTREAWAYAKQGRLAAFRRTTSKAEDLLRDGLATNDPHWISYFDEAELAGVTGGRLLEAARETPKFAEELAEETGRYLQRAVQLRRPQSLRSAALDQVGLAEARFVQEEPEEAAQLGLEALDVVERTHSSRVRALLIELYGCTEPYKSLPTVVQLRDRLAARLSVSLA